MNDYYGYRRNKYENGCLGICFKKTKQLGVCYISPPSVRFSEAITLRGLCALFFFGNQNLELILGS